MWVILSQDGIAGLEQRGNRDTSLVLLYLRLLNIFPLDIAKPLNMRKLSLDPVFICTVEEDQMKKWLVQGCVIGKKWHKEQWSLLSKKQAENILVLWCNWAPKINPRTWISSASAARFGENALLWKQTIKKERNYWIQHSGCKQEEWLSCHLCHFNWYCWLLYKRSLWPQVLEIFVLVGSFLKHWV